MAAPPKLSRSPSERLAFAAYSLAFELDVPYVLKKHQRGSNMEAPPELKAIHPLGKAPIITDGDVTVAESGAIVEYIIEKYGRTIDRPSETGKLDNRYWTHYAEGSLMPLFANKFAYTLIPEKKVPMLIRPLANLLFGGLASLLVDPGIQQNAQFIEDYLAKHSESLWFAHGEHPTAADYMMLFPLEALCTGRLGEPSLIGEHIRKWVDAVHARSAYQRALEKGGEYEFYS